ncbi:MAG TPA: TilS substrate-binding domain-containing protein, partial [Acidimicrobiia bacterium]|nr:TilS substrate-binding domain-containing protein [Acidimicrobiia bacterium]
GLRTRPLVEAPVPLARRAVRLWLGPPPPSAADVERVLAVARGACRATEVAGGTAIRRSAGELRRTAPVRAGGLMGDAGGCGGTVAGTASGSSLAPDASSKVTVEAGG